MQNSSSSTPDREIVSTRLVNAPRERVWDAWTTPGHLEKWWGPDGFTNTFHEISVKTGGIWRFTMHGPDGTDYPNRIIFDELRKPERISYLHDSDKENDPERFRSVVTFEVQGDKTLVTLRSVFPSAEERDRVVKEVGAIEGGKQTLGRLAAYVEMM